MILKTPDGTIIRADTAAEFVRQLHEITDAPCATDAEFMKEVANRTMTASAGSQKIRFENADEFLADLIHFGLVEQAS